MPMHVEESKAHPEQKVISSIKHKTLPMESGEFSDFYGPSEKSNRLGRKSLLLLSIVAVISVFAMRSLSQTPVLQAESTNGPSVEITGWSETTSLLDPIASRNLVVAGDYIYLFGGRKQNDDSSDIVYSARIQANGSVGNWAIGGTMPKPLYLHATVVFGDYVYIIGGWNANEPSISASPNDAVWRGQLQNDGQVTNWEKQTDYPIKVTLHQAVVVNQRIYVIGGYSTLQEEPISDVFYADINPATGQLGAWMSNTSLTEVLRRSSAVSTTVGGTSYIYVTGGSGTDTNSAFTKVYYSAVGADGIIEDWKAGTELPEARTYHAAVIHDGRLVVIGGRNSQGGLNTVWAATINPNGTLGTWSPLASIPKALFRFGAVSVNRYGSDFVIIAGGFVGDTAQSTVYNSTVPNTPTPTLTPTPTDVPTPTPTPTPTPGIDIQLSSNPEGWIDLGEQIEYTIEFVAPTAPITNVVIQSLLPNNVVLLPDTISASSGYQFNIVDNSIEWQIGDLAALGSGRLVYKMVRPTPAPPPPEAPNVLQVSLTGPTTASRGEPIEYLLTLENKSVIPLTGVSVRNTLPFGAVYIDGSGDPPVNGELSWTQPVLAPLATNIYTYTVVSNTSLLNIRYQAESAEGATAVGHIYVATNVDNQRPIVGDAFKIIHDGVLAKWQSGDSELRVKTDPLTNPTFLNYIPINYSDR